MSAIETRSFTPSLRWNSGAAEVETFVEVGLKTSSGDLALGQVSVHITSGRVREERYYPGRGADVAQVKTVICSLSELRCARSDAFMGNPRGALEHWAAAHSWRAGITRVVTRYIVFRSLLITTAESTGWVTTSGDDAGGLTIRGRTFKVHWAAHRAAAASADLIADYLGHRQEVAAAN